MPKRFTDGYFALVITCLFGMASIGVVSVGFYQLKGYQSADQEHAAYYAERHQAEVNYSECLDAAVTLNGARACINNAPSRTRDAQRAEQDLNAQREMAQWAEGMLWAAWTVGLLTFFATVIGVRYIYLTLVSTQDMAAKTESIGNKQVAASMAAVNAARDANQVAAQQFRAGFKPWISVEMKGPFIDMAHENPIRMFEGGEAQRIVPLNAQTFITCIGEIPVTIEDFDLLLAEGGNWPYVNNPPAGWGAKSEDFFTILPSKSAVQICPRMGITGHSRSFNFITITPENIDQFKMNPPPIVGKVIYSDPMGVRYEHNFAFVAYPTWGDSFKRWGGRERNYEIEIS